MNENSISISRELKKGENGSYGFAIVGAVIAAVGARNAKRSQDDSKRRAQKDKERAQRQLQKPTKQERKRLKRLGRETMSPVAQNSLPLTATTSDSKEASLTNFSPTVLIVIGGAVILFAILRR